LKDKEKLKIYIGWDSREDIAFQVAKQSILDTASVPVEIIPIKQNPMRKRGVYQRPVDQLASTEFTFTRFLVPYLAGYKGWALFIDCDFIAVDDVKKLFDQADDRYAIMCAQHNYTPKNTTKMDGQTQHQYPRKNWSSMMLINCGHESNAKLTPALINNLNFNGAYFHRFQWLKDNQIGKVSHEWNWLVNWYKEPKDGKPKFIHYTEGGPWFEEYETCEYAIDWYRSYKRYTETQQQSIEKAKQKLNAQAIDIEKFALNEDKSKLFKEIIDYIIDPDNEFLSAKRENIDKYLEDVMGNKVAAIDSDGGVNYKSKGLEYDAYLKSFILGSGGIISSWRTQENKESALVIRGLGGGSRKAIQHCWKTGRTFYAIDTGYFGNEKSKYWHRITKNELQHTGPIIKRPDDRLSGLGWKFMKFTPGRKILICPPSLKVMDLWGQPDPETWTNQVIEELRKYTDRPVEVRLKPTRAERVTNKTIHQALADDVHCLITYNSIAATEALLFGKPAIALGPNAAQVLCNTSLSDVENLNIPDKDQMTMFARHLSYCQFNQQEMQNGTAWRIINESS